MSNHFKHLFTRPKAQTDEYVEATTLTAVEEEMNIFGQIYHDLEQALSSPPNTEQPQERDEEQIQYLNDLVEQGVKSRNKLHYLLQEPDTSRKARREYLELKEQFNHLQKGYRQGTPQGKEVEKRPEVEEKGLRERATETYRRLTRSRDGSGA